MMKKITMGAGALALTFGLVACGDDNGGSVSDLTTTYASDSSSVSIDGQIEATNKIFDVSYTLVDAKGAAIVGAIEAYSLKDAIAAINKSVETDTVLLVNIGKAADGAPGLDAVVNFKNIDSTHCGELTLTVTAQVESDATFGSGDKLDVSSSVALQMPCKSNKVDATVDVPDFDSTITNALVEVKDSIGGAKATLGSSYDLDAGKSYTSGTVATVKDEIDLIFNGSKFMTPWGTSDVGYMSKTFSSSKSEAVIIPVAADFKAAVVSDLAKFDASKAVYVADVNTTTASAFIVITSKYAPVFVKVETISGTQVLTFKYAK